MTKRWMIAAVMAALVLSLSAFSWITTGRKGGIVMESANMVQNSENGAVREEMLDVNNVRLSVKEAGSGPDMILIHGRTLSKETMDPLFEYYKDRYHVISYDVRGHGKTE